MSERELHPAAAPAQDAGEGKVRRPRRKVVGTALLLVACIILPSAVLGYLSWQAIEHERSYAL